MKEIVKMGGFRGEEYNEKKKEKSSERLEKEERPL